MGSEMCIRDRAGTGERRAHRRGSDAIEGRADHRLRRARLLRQAAQAVHGRLGPRHHHHYAFGSSAPLPRRPNDRWACLRKRPQLQPARDLVELAGLPGLSGYSLDARTLPVMRISRTRLGWLPVSGLCRHGIGGQCGSGLRQIRLPRRLHATRPERIGSPGGGVRLQKTKTRPPRGLASNSQSRARSTPPQYTGSPPEIDPEMDEVSIWAAERARRDA